MRPKFNREEMMQKALEEAQKAFDADEVPVGAALFDADGRLVAADHNRVEEWYDPTAHAEILVIKKACMALETTNLKDYILCITLEPCAMCAQGIAWAKVGEVRYGAFDEKSGGVKHGARIFEQKNCHHHPVLYGGLLDDEPKRLLQTFFQKKRRLATK